MRITGGEWGGRQLKGSPGPHVRPTTDIAREAFFNILQHRIDWEETVFLDLFSGTGIMALEAISRGCSKVVSVDKNPKSLAYLKSLRTDFCKDSDSVVWDCLQGDALSWSKTDLRGFDLIYADPPYDWSFYPVFVSQCLENMQSGALLCVEHQKQLVLTHPCLERSRAYGHSVMSFFRK